MTNARSWKIGAMLGVELAVVLAGPLLLVWSQIRPQPWDWRTLGVRFESARYEAAALVFTYRIQNRTRWSVRLLPDMTKVVAQQPSDRPAVGFPALEAPLELEAHATQRLEVRLQLPSRPLPTVWSELPEDQAKRMLQLAMPEAADAQQPLWPLPPQIPGKAVPEPEPTESVVASTLADLNGFELINESKGLHLVLPRGW